MINTDALGIIFPNMHDANLPELVKVRTMGSLPFAGRYRMIDFCLSGMAAAGMKSIGVITHKNYQSLMDHLGNGREWDLSSKRGGLVLFPPNSRQDSELYSSRIEALLSVLEYLQARREELVVMSDCDVALNIDYRDLLAKHRAAKAEVTVVYCNRQAGKGVRADNFALQLDERGRVCDIRVGEYKKGAHNYAVNVFVMARERLVNMLREAAVQGAGDFVRDFLAKNLEKRRVYGYEFTGYSAHICDMQSYFEENLRLCNNENLKALFVPQRPIYTKVRDEAPVRYAIGAKVGGSLIADGCIIEGEVVNSVLFRGVRVGKGSSVKNCVLMQGTEIGPQATMENVITDKNVQIGAGQFLHGAASFPVFIGKGVSVL